MQLYILDDNLVKTDLFEGYSSLIWTERYDQSGDITLVVPANQTNATQLQPGVKLALDLSTYVMELKTITDKTDDDGNETLTITGISLEDILNDRMGMTAQMVADIVTYPKWVITDDAGDIAREMFKTICVDLSLDPGDAIPFYQPGTILPTGNIAEPLEVITVEADPDTLYNQIKNVCTTYGLGFRFVRSGEISPKIYFEVYMGSDRTSSQTTLPAVIFDPSMDNLADISRLTSTSGYKNTAYVVGKDEVKVVYGVGEDTDAAGFDRRVLFVNANNVDETNVSDVDAALQQAGLAALASQRKIYQFDGEISEYGVYTYGVDYQLGDLVEERDSTGLGNQMKVTEQIFVSDDEGDRSYPTLTLSNVIVPGTWIDVKPPTEDWADVPEDQVWGNQ